MGHVGHVGHTGTEKKNPFVMTIGFDKNDPEHVEVAEFLNSLPRKKAQYIVEAIRRIVLQVLAERSNSIPQPAIHERATLRADDQDTNADTTPDTEPDTAAGMIAGIDQSDLEVIFGFLEALRG